jgi:hypothetical protein
MSLTAYLDESYTDKAIVCAGWVGRAEDWELFCGDWQAGLAMMKAPYLHMKELGRDGVKDPKSGFYKWRRDRVDRLVNHMIPIARQKPMFGVVATIDLKAYKEIIHPNLQAEYKIPYCFVFQVFFDVMLRVLKSRTIMRPYYIGEPVMLIHEDNKEFAPYVLEAYSALREAKQDSWRIGGISFQPWQRHQGLQAADLLANRYQKITHREIEGERHISEEGWNYELTRDANIIIASMDRNHLTTGMERIRRKHPEHFAAGHAI